MAKFVQFDEFKLLMQNIFGNKTDYDETKRLFRIMDKDKNGKITLEEFISGMNPNV
jgi:Ca2+-binding EF-hand superfamily protein